LVKDENDKLVKKPFKPGDEQKDRDEPDKEMSLVTYSKLYQEENKAKKEAIKRQHSSAAGTEVQASWNTAAHNLPTDQSGDALSFQPNSFA